MGSERLARQLDFILEIDRLKGVLRQTWLTDRSRQENSAEHSWHLAVMAVLLAEHANAPVDVARVVKMLLVHDIIEVDAGDTFAYDDNAHLDKAEREQRAADRLFNLLPADQAAAVRALWDEFEGQATPDARFANALDRLQPMLLNYQTQGAAWRKHGVTTDLVLSRNQHMAAGSQALWDYASAMIADAVARGYLKPGEP